MIFFIKGTLESKKVNRIVVETGGVGYEISIPLSTFHNLPEEKQSVKIYTYVVKKEDEESIYGFLSETDREIFKIIISIKGLGPKIALALLSFFTVSELYSIIMNENKSKLCSCPGIGKKTAERIVFELKDKFGSLDMGIEIKDEDRFYNDALSGLVALGYKTYEARRVLDKVKDEIKDIKSAEELLKKALRYL